MSQKFFEEREDQSEVKARIVSKYFFAWANVILPTVRNYGGKIAYIDLFAGPGRYKDGSSSTPIMIIEQVLANSKLKNSLVSMFNDENPDHAEDLRVELDKISNISELRYPPKISSGSVGDEIATQLSEVRMIPTFSFIDPFGYKGLSLKLVNGAIKDWGCDCVFFFNYNRINAGISNPLVDNHMEALFETNRAEQLRDDLVGKTANEREQLILEKLTEALKGMGGNYVLPFRFRNSKGTRSSHYLIFVSKHVKGYAIMKEIMFKESSTFDQGVASLEYSPATAMTPLLFSLAQPLDKLKEMLPSQFSGESLPMKTIYEMHHVDTPYIKKNYKSALLELEHDGRVTAAPSANNRRKDTFADDVIVKFP